MFESNKYKKLIITTIIVVVISIILCVIVNISGLDDINTIKKLITDGILGAVIYVFLLALQILFVPINSLILIIPAIIIFGPLSAFVLSIIGVMLGSIIAYYMGIVFGESLLNWLVGKKSSAEWREKLSKNGKYLLPFLMLIPIFPDEIVCVMSGVVRINFVYFFVVSLITRIFDLICTCFIGAIIPFQGWWLLFWIAFMILGCILTVYLVKKQDALEKYISNIWTKFSKKKPSR